MDQIRLQNGGRIRYQLVKVPTFRIFFWAMDLPNVTVLKEMLRFSRKSRLEVMRLQSQLLNGGLVRTFSMLLVSYFSFAFIMSKTWTYEWSVLWLAFVNAVDCIWLQNCGWNRCYLAKVLIFAIFCWAMNVRMSRFFKKCFVFRENRDWKWWDFKASS